MNELSSSAREASALHRSCPLCGRDNRQLPTSRYSQGVWRLKACADCELLYLENALPCEALVEDYSWRKSFAQEDARRNQREDWRRHFRQNWKRWRMRWLPHRKAEALIARYVGAGNVLDIGCGIGSLFLRFSPAIVPYGIEIDGRAIATARSHAEPRGGHILHADALQGLGSLDDRSMDGVVMLSFLEHEIRPLEVLGEVRRVLRPGGVAILKVPNFDCWNRSWRKAAWPGFRFPDHVNYFTPKSLVQIVVKSGLQVRQFGLRDRLPTSDNMWMVAAQER